MRRPSFSLLRKFGADTRGLAAIEFALILPFMAILYFGAIETSLVISADRKVTETASSLADLVARTDTIDADEIADVFDAARAMFEPYAVDGVEMRVTSIIDDSGVSRVDWSKAKNLDPLRMGDKVKLEPGIMPTGGSVIMAEISYNYKSSLGFFLKDGIVLHQTFYLRPRMSDQVTWSGA
ncbi:MAG: pilus assembly protein [Alphaproteobacteria bacterium]|nr:pilus assembly protein [Alphaproteobacteria bacterium]